MSSMKACTGSTTPSGVDSLTACFLQIAMRRHSTNLSEWKMAFLAVRFMRNVTCGSEALHKCRVRTSL